MSYVPYARILAQNIKQADKAIKEVDVDLKKASHTAARVEGFRLRKLLMKDLNRAAPGGIPLDPLSEIAKLLRDKRKTPGIKPLKPLAKRVAYRAQERGGRMTMDVGFVDPGGAAKALPESWKRIAAFQQKGGTFPVPDKIRRAAIYRGTRKGPRSKARKLSLLRKATTHFRTPARPVIYPFWRVHKREALMNVKRNFQRKMAGERI